MEQVHDGNFIKLQKPDVETFTNVSNDEDGKAIGNCTVCNTNGVLVDDHVCQTMINTNEHFKELSKKYPYVGSKMVTKIKWLKDFK